MDHKKLSPLILALDTSDLEEARRIADRVSEHVDVVKVGLQLFSSAGTDSIGLLKSDGFEVFLDVKMMDIPNTVALAIGALCDLEPLMLTVHTMGGQEMLKAAKAAAERHCRSSNLREAMIIGVTVLTSLDILAMRKIGLKDSVEGQVVRLAKLASESGLDGLVTSPLEILIVRREVGSGVTLITPGVRLAGSSQDDQKRVATPAEAVRAGADFLVVGRPLYRAKDPKAVAREILDNIDDERPE